MVIKLAATVLTLIPLYQVYKLQVAINLLANNR